MKLWLLAFFALTVPAQAHDFWINHGSYKSPADGTHCCGKNDCHLFPIRNTRVNPDGSIELRWPDGSIETVPANEVMTSEDNDVWRCARHDGSRRCFFYPQGGV